MIFRILVTIFIWPLLLLVITVSQVRAAENIILQPAVGDIGDDIRITGSDFEAYGAQVYIYLSSQKGMVYDKIDDNITVYKLLVKTVANDDGKIRTYFELPAQLDEGVEGGFGGFQEVVSGNYYIYATYGDTDQIEAVSEFTVKGIILNHISGLTGDEVEVTGYGLGKGLSVTVSFGGSTVTVSEADEYGGFITSFTVPDVRPSFYDVIAQDTDGNNAQATYMVEMPPSISITPTTNEESPGYVGMEITIGGAGFEANAVVDIIYDDAQVAGTPSDVNGKFLTIFKVPESAAGEHSITATDGINSRQVFFIMESQAPSQPALLLPEDEAEIEELTKLNWNTVSDNSRPVSYDLQIASSKDFAENNILLEKKGLSGSKYTIGQEERRQLIEEASYYWRVRATDGAANESKWSTSSFYIVKPTATDLPAKPEQFGWLLYVWIGLAALVAVVVGYWIRKKIVSSRRISRLQ